MTDDWQWRNWLWQWRSDPARQQAELQRYADSLKDDNWQGSVWPHKNFQFAPRHGRPIEHS
ncbi:hypothetical protein [Methylobacterium brachiatum]|uniref:hypothetical protein n=1 Tax=Methylobacterium brachiatum TaxID=269660 RepID=UPI0013CE4AF2|nr:hypothetical protein [Methylobacterium brachiatum]